MDGKPRTVEVRLEREAFREFAVFDGLLRRRRWLRPAAFALFFCALAVTAFLRTGVEGARLLGGVLLAVGLGLPAVYLGFFFRSVAVRAAAIDPRETVYTLALGEDALGVRKGAQSAAYAWDGLHAAYRLRRCVCLYTDPAHAFLAPDEAGDVWRFVSEKLDKSRLHDRARDK